jgi:hypothetical protein
MEGPTNQARGMSKTSEIRCLKLLIQAPESNL